MTMHDALPAVWHALRPPVVALAVALAARAAGHLLRRAWVEQAACGLGIAAGILALPALPLDAHLLLHPHGMAQRLPGAALAGLVAVLLAGRAPARAGLIGIVLAVVSGWWLAGAPLDDAGVRHALPAAVAIAVVSFLAMRGLEDGDVWRGLAAAAALWGGLVAVGEPPFWTLVAMVPGAALLGLLPGRAPGPALLPAGAAIGAVGGAVVLAAGGLSRGGSMAAGVAALAPLLVLYLAPRLGRGGPAVAALIAACVGIALAGLAARVVPML